MPAAARLDTVIASARTTVFLLSWFGAALWSWPAPEAGLAATLLLDPHVADHRGGVDGLDHVDQRERGHGHRRQRLHLHPGPVSGADPGLDRDRVVAHRQVHGHRVNRYRVTQRDQIRCPLGALDAGDPGNGEGVPLGHLPLPDRGDGRAGQQHPARCAGFARGYLLAGDIYHPGVPRLVQMGQAVAHGSDITSAASPASIETTGSGTTISTFATAIAPSWCEPWPVSGVTVPASGSSAPRR